MQVLLLNASYEPIDVVSWKRATTMVLGGRAELVESRDEMLRSAGGFVMPMPAVVRLVKMAAVPRSRDVPLTRRALQARDQNVCQVFDCDARGSTVDHVVPRSRGGRHEWGNVALMCGDHNSAKDDRTLDELGWNLKKVPAVPVAMIMLQTSVLGDPLLARWV